ncbi:MAG: N-6 DNA methylase, partial [bacterium]
CPNPQIVVGNPPYGSAALKTVRVLPALKKRFQGQVFHRDGRVRDPLPEEAFVFEMIRRLSPDGWLAMILPEGLLGNRRSAPLRRWMLQRGHPRAVVSFPPGLFSRSGAQARTVLLVFQKGADGSKDVIQADFSRESFSARKAGAVYRDLSRKFHAVAVAKKKNSPENPDTFRLALDRATLCESSWLPAYWKPRTELDRLSKARNQVQPLGDFIQLITYGAILPGRRPEDFSDSRGVAIVGQPCIGDTGLDLSKAKCVAPGCAFDPPGRRLRRGDLLVARSGVGSLLKGRMALFLDDAPATVSCFVNLIRLDGISPVWALLFLRSRWGRAQIERQALGVGVPNLNFDQWRGLLIPVPPGEVLAQVEQRFAALHKAHMAALAKPSSIPHRAASCPDISFDSPRHILENLIGFLESSLESLI